MRLLMILGCILLLSCAGGAQMRQYAGYVSGFRVTDWRGSVESARREAFRVCGPYRNVVIQMGPKRDPKRPCW